MKSSRSKPKIPSEIGERRAWIPERWQLVLFAVGHLVIFLVVFQHFYKIQYSPAGIYMDYASNVLNGKVPYRDFPFEYPPLSVIFFILPKIFTSTWQGFTTFFQGEIMIFDFIGLFILYLISRRLGKSPWIMLAVYSAAILAIGPIIEKQYDLFPAVITLLAVFYFWLNHHKTAWVLIALGTMIKLYPVLLAPIFLIFYYRNHQYARIRSAIFAFAVPCLIILLPFFILSPSSLMSLVNYHSQRGIQLESAYGAILLVAQKLGWLSTRLDYNFGSYNFSGSAAQFLDKISLYLLAAGIILTIAFIYFQVRAGKSQFSRIGSYFLLVILIVLVTSKVLSPQYLIWLIPALPLVFGTWRFYIWLLFFAIGGLTYYIFPLHYLELTNFSTPEVIVLVIRDVLLLVMGILLLINLRRRKASD
jgi:uncharacterized membrane protein